MTVGGDFIPTGDGREAEVPSYPKIFGVSLTPTVTGISLAVIGGIASIWLYFNLVQPTLERNQELSQDINNKQQQLQSQAETQKQIADARKRLQDAKQLQADVLGLFATKESLDTLLLDVNARVQAVNAGIQDSQKRATLSRFDLDDKLSGPVTDGSLGAAVNNRLERRVYNVEIKGTFPQTQSIIRNIERLQPLLVVSNLKSELDPTSQKIILDNQGRLVPTQQPESRVTTSFQLAALVPTSEMQSNQTQAGQAASPSATPTQPAK
jgi:type IV pilus assembly protein PilO